MKLQLSPVILKFPNLQFIINSSMNFNLLKTDPLLISIYL